MDVKAALKSQYKAALAALRQAIERCPDDVWVAGEHPRCYWRIAYHGLFFADFYLQQSLEGFKPWEKHRNQCPHLEELPWPPNDIPKVETPYTQAELLEYADLLAARCEDVIDKLDLDTEESGFPWYRMPKLDHEILNIRHMQTHAGQLSEHLIAAGVDVDWTS